MQYLTTRRLKIKTVSYSTSQLRTFKFVQNSTSSFCKCYLEFPFTRECYNLLLLVNSFLHLREVILIFIPLFLPSVLAEGRERRHPETTATQTAATSTEAHQVKQKTNISGLFGNVALSIRIKFGGFEGQPTKASPILELIGYPENK